MQVQKDHVVIFIDPCQSTFPFFVHDGLFIVGDRFILDLDHFDLAQYGISMLSKRKPVSVSKVLMRGSSHTRALMICDYGDMVVANTHFPLSEETRLEAAADVRRNLRELALKKPVFLMGDLNAVPESSEILSLKKDFTVLSDETIPTWPAKEPKIMIDYIMVDKAHADNVKVVSKRTVAAPDATDHSAVVVDVELSRRKIENSK